MLLAVIGLVFWLIVGLAVTSWYDRPGTSGTGPEMLAYVPASVAAYRIKRGADNERDAAAALGITHPEPGQPND
jgi:hypothetical protein